MSASASKGHIQVFLYDEPKGQLLGHVALDVAQPHRRPARVALAVLYANKPASIRLSLPQELGLKELQLLSTHLAGFQTRVAEVEATLREQHAQQPTRVPA